MLDLMFCSVFPPQNSLLNETCGNWLDRTMPTWALTGFALFVAQISILDLIKKTFS